MRFGRVAIGGRRRRTIIYCVSYNGREIFTPKLNWTFFQSFQKQNKCNILSPASRKPAPPSDAVCPKYYVSASASIFLDCVVVHRRLTPVAFNNIVVRIQFKINFTHNIVETNGMYWTPIGWSPSVDDAFSNRTRADHYIISK